MKATRYIYGYLIFLAALFASIFITNALGWTFFEMGVTASLIFNTIFGIVPFAIGLGCLLLANIFFKTIDVTLPRAHFFVWSLASGFVFGLSYAISVPLINGVHWATFVLNGLFVHTVFPPLLVSAIYIGLKRFKVA